MDFRFPGNCRNIVGTALDTWYSANLLFPPVFIICNSNHAADHNISRKYNHLFFKPV